MFAVRCFDMANIPETMLLESGVDVRLFLKEDASLAEARKRFFATT
jgi:hypothetical protein